MKSCYNIRHNIQPYPIGQWPYNHFYTICYIRSHLVLVKSSIAYCKISHSSLSVTGHLLTDSCQCSAHFVNLIASMLSPASLFVPIQTCCTTKISSNINGEHGGASLYPIPYSRNLWQSFGSPVL